MVKHSLAHHEGSHPSYYMKILRRHKTAMSRQISESVLIELSSADIIMNSKGEWNGSRIPRVILEVGNSVMCKVLNMHGGRFILQIFISYKMNMLLDVISDQHISLKTLSAMEVAKRMSQKDQVENLELPTVLKKDIINCLINK